MTLRDEVTRLLAHYQCQCGSGGALACEDDCPGESKDFYAREAILLIVEALERRNVPQSPSES